MDGTTQHGGRASRRRFLRASCGAMAAWAAGGVLSGRARSDAGVLAAGSLDIAEEARPRMKLGCMLYSLSRSLSEGALRVPEALALMKECGCEGVDLMQPLPGGSVAEARAMVADAGLVVSSHIGGADTTQSDPAARTAAVDACKRVVDEAHELGTPLVLLTTAACRPGLSGAEARRNIAEALCQVVPYAGQAGITVTIEDFGVPNAPYQTGSEVLECCTLTDAKVPGGPGLMVTYDTGNMFMGGEDPVDFLRIVAPRVRHCHVKDWEPLPDGATNGLPARDGKRYIGAVVGSGVLSYPPIIAELRRIGYDGFVSFEYEGPGDSAAALRQGMEYLATLV